MVKVKVCGMRQADNIRALLDLKPAYVGFIFYDKSPRYVGDDLDVTLLASFPKTVKKVGVFVNANFDFILTNVRRYGLDFAQLHGNETPEFCRSLGAKGVHIIKAFAVGPDFNFGQLNNYKPHCDYFLFDTQGAYYGGNGESFDWQILDRYDNQKPYFLSGGIGPSHAESLAALAQASPALHAIDLNSGFETAPGLKDTALLGQFLLHLEATRQPAEPPVG